MTYFSRLRSAQATPKIVGFVGFDGLMALDVTGPLQAFATARFADEPYRQQACYKALLIGAETKTFVSEAGVTFKAHHTLGNAPAVDTIIVAGGTGLRNADLSERIAAWLLERSKSTRRIATVCTGIYPLARTGLLDGRCVTTHWRFAQDLARTFPRLRVEQAASFIKDEPFSTCGGGSGGMEMALSLVKDDYGPKVALAVARELVIDLRPSGGNGQLVDAFDYQPGSEERIGELPAWITTHLRQDLSVEELAKRTCLCPRHFNRVFKRAFGMTPAEFVETSRIAEAKRRLASRDDSIASVAASVGFKSADAFRRAFERRLGILPTKFRRSTETDIRIRVSGTS
ncbi:MAG: helix-turn-helix domain-containing protein [Chthoniobacterales bacterium]